VKTVLLGLLWLYRRAISPALAPRCRFEPSCSAYAEQAIRTHGAAQGGWLALKRLLRCQPFARGGIDPVPRPGSPRHAE
jgi:uncharacterized protein